MEPIFFWSRQFTRGRKKKERKLQSGIHGRKTCLFWRSRSTTTAEDDMNRHQNSNQFVSFSTRLPKRDALSQKNNTNNRKKNRWMSSTVLLYNKKRSSDAVCFLVTFFCYNNQVGLVDKFELERMCWEEKWNYNFARTSNVNLVMNSELQ